MCEDTLSCEETCGEYRYFCPMWTEHSGEMIIDKEE